MATNWDYKREVAATVSDIAEVIHASVSIADALSVYCPHLTPRHNRCPCPIHNGTDYNFTFNEHFFKCFVCNESGDVVSLVKGVCELPTRLDAMKRICDDFHLPVNFRTTITHEVSAKVNQARQESERKRKAREEWEEEYHRILDQWIELDKLVDSIPWDSEENIARLCKAKEEKAKVGYMLDEISSKEPR